MQFPVSVEGVSLDKSSISLTTAGQTYQLTATITPIDADDTALTWASSDTSVATVSQTGLVTCVTPGICTITVTTHDGGYTATCNVMGATVLFDYGDWTNSVWSDEGYVRKYTDKVTIYSSSGYASVYLSQYQIDLTKDFLLEMNAYLPNTSAGYHFLGLWSSSNEILFSTRWEGGSNMYVRIDGNYTITGYYNPGTADYFIRKQGTTITMGFNGNTIHTATYTATSGLYLYVSVYRDTCTINTAKLTYL